MADIAIYAIIDGSGSMRDIREQVRDGLNEYVKEQKETAFNDTVLFSLTVFDDKVVKTYEGEDISLIKEFTTSDIFLGGSTALYDAIGKTLSNADEDPADRNLVVIYTDGHENASREFKREQIADMIRDLEATGKWQVVYLGAEFADFAKEADMIAVAASHTVNTARTAAGVTGTWKNISGTTTHYRSVSSPVGTEGILASADAAGASNWNATIPVATDTSTATTSANVDIAVDGDEEASS